MRKNLFLSTIISLIGLFSLTAFAQVKPTIISGDVVSISAEKIVLKTANGEVEALLSDKTKYLRVPPENPSPSAATPSTFAEVGVGDKVLISVIMPEDKKNIPVRSVYLMSKSEIAQRQAEFTEDWKKRGSFGFVDRYDPMTKIITISMRNFGVEKKIAVKATDKTEFYRYAPDSIEVKISKNTRSTLNDIEVGDQLRVLGNKNADGTEIEAEKIISGSFKQSVGTVKSIDLEKKEIVITDSQTKKDIAVAISDNTILKQFPPEMAQRMTQMQMMQAGGGQGGFRPPTPGGGQTTPQPNPQPNPQPSGQTPTGQGQGGGLRQGGGFDDSRLPPIKIEELKVGEAIGVLSSKNQEPSRIKAIKLFSGVELFIKMAEMAAARGGGGGNRQGGGASMNIPGLDGFGGN